MTTDTFAINVYNTLPSLRPYARRLWPNAADREDGMSECLVRALEKRGRFDGRNLAAWLTRIMRNIRTNQFSKGYRKGTRPESVSDRIVYVGDYAPFDGIATCPWVAGRTRYNKKDRKVPLRARATPKVVPAILRTDSGQC